VVNFTYVSSPKFVPNQKDFIISAASVSRFWSCQSFWNFSTLPMDGQTRLLALWKQIQNSSCRQVVYSKIIIFTTLSKFLCPFASPFWNTCISPTSHGPIKKPNCTIRHCSYNHSVNSSSHSVIGDIAIQWEWSKFDHSYNPNPLTDYDKTLHNWLLHDTNT